MRTWMSIRLNVKWFYKRFDTYNFIKQYKRENLNGYIKSQRLNIQKNKYAGIKNIYGAVKRASIMDNRFL